MTSMHPDHVELELAARKHIEEDTPFAYDVALEHGQMLDNVKHMKWFRDAVVDALTKEAK